MSDCKMVPESFTFGDLTFHAYDNRVLQRKKVLDINGKGYLILIYLALRARADNSACVSSTELFEYVYRGKIRSSNSMTVFVSRLRDQLENAGSSVTLKSAGHKGYRLIVPPKQAALPEAAA